MNGIRRVLGAAAGCVLVLAGALRAQPDDPVALFGAGRFEEARAAFERRLEGRPDDPVALYYLGRLTPDGARSQGCFERLLNTSPGHALADDALFELAEAEYAGPSGLYVRARGRYRDLLDAYPDSPLAARALYRVGLTFRVTRQPDSAAAAFEEILRRFPESEMAPYARFELGEGPAPQGELSEAQPVVRGRFWVQVGAFGNLENLRRLAGRLRAAGLAVREEPVLERELVLLLAGPFADAAEAEAVRRRVEAAEGLQCRVIEKP